MSCFDCKYQKLGGYTFLGLCMWFEIVKQQPPKEIPSTVVDVGCKFKKPKEGK